MTEREFLLRLRSDVLLQLERSETVARLLPIEVREAVTARRLADLRDMVRQYDEALAPGGFAAMEEAEA